MAQTGRCLCGAVSYTAQDVDTHVHGCHCSMCRRWTGSTGMAAAVGSVVFSGTEHIGRYESSPWAERGFCRECGSSLFFRLREADRYMMWMGSFDDVSKFELAGEIYVDEKPPGYEFAGDHPRQTGEEFLASLESE